jgi:Tfp pilus assembly protein PilE
MKKHIALARQRGITLLGLLIVGGILGFFGIVAAQAIPSVSEYLSIKKSLKTIANMGLGTVAEIQTKFDATKHLDDIKTLSGKDLIITKRNDKTVIAFAYQKEIPVIEPVFVVIKYAGSTDDK